MFSRSRPNDYSSNNRVITAPMLQRVRGDHLRALNNGPKHGTITRPLAEIFLHKADLSTSTQRISSIFTFRFIGNLFVGSFRCPGPDIRQTAPEIETFQCQMWRKNYLAERNFTGSWRVVVSLSNFFVGCGGSRLNDCHLCLVGWNNFFRENIREGLKCVRLYFLGDT